jgi:hypothetical protein
MKIKFQKFEKISRGFQTLFSRANIFLGKSKQKKEEIIEKAEKKISGWRL